MLKIVTVGCILLMVSISHAQEKWWLTEPIRLIQTNLRETDSGLDAVALVEQLAEYPANTLLFSVGGITAHYPTKVELHRKSPSLPAGKDLVGDVIREAHQRNIRVIGRFDFSRTARDVYEAHPEWFYRRADGQPIVDDNDLYSVCINGGYYRDKGLEILNEALEAYEVDGLFFNWFGNVRSDYKGNNIGLCHCENCEKKFAAKYGRPVPDVPDLEYEQFIYASACEVAKMYGDLIHQKRPGALFMTYLEEITDGIVSEADFYKWRPLPQWIYSASEQVNRALNSYPEKMAFDLVMPYVEMRYRFAAQATPGLRAFLYQNIAHGAFPAFVVLGTLDQPDRRGLHEVRPVFQWHQQHEELLTGQKNAARVLHYARQDRTWSAGSQDYRGFIRLLTELHIPYKISQDIPMEASAENIDLVVVPEGPVPAEIRRYVENGGNVLVAGATFPGLDLPPVQKLWKDAKSAYMRIDDHSLFPSLKEADVLFCEGDYLELAPVVSTPITFIPPSQFGPPDKVSTIAEKTDKPGLVLHSLGKGQVAFVPWNIGRLYYLYSNDAHRLFISDLIDALLPNGRQVFTNAHGAVEITLMRQPDNNRTLLHLINLSGHQGTAFFPAVPIANIHIRVAGKFSAAKSIKAGKQLAVDFQDGYSVFTVPRLEEYELVELDEN